MEVVLIVVGLVVIGVVVFGVVVVVAVALVATVEVDLIVVGVMVVGLVVCGVAIIIAVVVGVIFVVVNLDPICFNVECLVVDTKTGDGRSLVDEMGIDEGIIKGRFGETFLIDITEFATRFLFLIFDEFWSILVSSFVSESSKEGGDGGPGR